MTESVIKNELFRFVHVRPVKRPVLDKSSNNLIYYPDDWKSQSEFFKSFVDDNGNVIDYEISKTGVQKYNTVYANTSMFNSIDNFLDRIYSLILIELPTAETVEKWCQHYLKISTNEFVESQNFKTYYIYLWDTILLRFFNRGISVPPIPTCSARIKGLRFISNIESYQTTLEKLVKSTLVLPKISKYNQNNQNNTDTELQMQKQDPSKEILIKEYESVNNAEKEIRKIKKQQVSDLRRVNTIDNTIPASDKLPVSVFPSWVIPNEKKKSLSKETSQVLAKYNLYAGDIDIIDTINNLKVVKSNLYSQINHPEEKFKVQRIGKKYYSSKLLKEISKGGESGNKI